MSLRHIRVSFESRLKSWWRAFTRRSRLEEQMDAELADHAERLTEDLVRAGHSHAEARRRARIAMGPALLHKEQMRASLGLRWWDEFRADARYAGRMLFKSPGFTAVAVISLALAIGANATIFSVAKQILYERLAVPQAGELRLLAWTGDEAHVAVHSIWGNSDRVAGGGVTSNVFSYAAFQHLRAENRVLGGLFAFKRTEMTAVVRGSAIRIRGEMVSGNYYSELGVRPVLGRGISPADENVQASGSVAVIGYGLWEREFGMSPSVIGQVIKVNETPLTIVGVNPKEFTSAKDVQTPADVMMPIELQPQVSPQPWPDALTNPEKWWVNIMVRIKPGMNETQAQAALNTQLSAIVRGTMPVEPQDDLPRLELLDGSRGLFEQEAVFSKPMGVLMTLVGLVLLLACANIANLMLARGTQRHREMSVRLALGAGRTRILRQMLVESLMLAGFGGGAGLLAAFAGRNLIPRMIENAWEQNDLHVHFDWRVFGFTAGITIVTGLLFGLAPAWAAARSELVHGLKETAQTTTRRRRGLGGRALVGFQIALSTLLVIGAGLFLRTLAGLTAVNVGFRTDHLLLVEINPQPAKYPAGKDVLLHQRLEQAFAALPGVESITPSQTVYIADDRMQRNFVTEGVDAQHDKDTGQYFNIVGNGFFRTLGIPIIAGRAFGPQDTATSIKVGIINQRLARERFGTLNPIGRRFAIKEGEKDGERNKIWIEIVGVCADTRYSSLRTEPPAQFFMPFAQRAEVGAMTYEIRTEMDPASMIPALKQAAQRIDPTLPLANVRTQDEQIAAAMQQERVFVVLTSGFGLLALALASVGIYGIMAYSVANRIHEIGIRLALGAQPGQVRGMILRESTWLALAGIAAGLAAALALAHVVKSMLYGIAPDDPVALGSGVALLMAVALVSSCVPARRAAGVEPMAALRHE